MEEDKKSIILVVNDDEAGRYATVRVLRQNGFETLEAANGHDGLKCAAQNPDLILLDVKMPDMSGFEVCAAIKANPQTHMIPVLHLSAEYGDSSSKVQGLNSGADGYLVQPVEAQELVAHINALLRMKRAENEARETAKKLQEALDHIKVLSGLLSICSYCKKIHNEKGSWEQLESYITNHSETLFSHGMCPDCEKKAYEDFDRMKKPERK